MHWITAATALAFAAPAAAGGLTIEDKTIEAKSAGSEITAHYPRTGVKAIDEDIAGWVEREVAAFKRDAAPEQESAAGAWTLDIGYTVERNDEQALALLFTLSSYTGGAHGGLTLIGGNYLLPEGTRVDLPQLLDGRRGLARLGELAIADLDRQRRTSHDTLDADWIRRGAAANWDNYQTFLLLPDALRIVFPPYQVASWADGPQQVTLPLSKFAGVLRKDPRAPAASFDCLKASTAVEQAICADAALARLDRDLAQAYGRRIGEVDAVSDREILRSAQRRWLGRRDAACADQSGAALGTCLTGVYRTRLAEFAEVR